jgi:hypothetical protein
MMSALPPKADMPPVFRAPHSNLETGTASWSRSIACKLEQVLSPTHTELPNDARQPEGLTHRHRRDAQRTADPSGLRALPQPGLNLA